MAKVGRPRSDTEQITVRLSTDLIANIDQLRKGEHDIPTRPEMIRRMLQSWIEENAARQDG